jgi:cytochrome c oxidase subunit 2
VPALGGKTDNIPGKTNHTWFQAQKVGSYPIRCAEFCGIQHTAMRGVVQVLPRTQNIKLDEGKEAFQGACATCHGLDGQGLVGPAITTSQTLQDPVALRKLLQNGGTRMPAVGKTWDATLTKDLLRYLKSRFGSGSGG